jgi:hypothetical protein
MLFGCGSKVQGTAETEQPQHTTVSCIAVLPSASISKGEAVPIYVPKEKSDRRGVQAMNEILSDELGGKEKIRFVGIDQIAAFDLTGSENQLTLARMVGERANCNAVLESSVKRFVERVGGRYSVESPASVAFDMRLISIESGSILWSTKFDEYQKSVMENIYEWNKANTRGFVWITAEELMREGVKAKLAASPYFNPAEK